jgi:hypothetical protein
MKKPIEDAQRRLAEQLLSRKGVSGVAIGAAGGRPCLRVYVSGSGGGKIPSKFDGHPVVVVGGGPFHALGESGGGESR